MNKVTNLKELGYYIDSLLDQNKDISSTDYDTIILKLGEEYNIETNKQELDRLFSPTLEEEDQKLIMQNSGVN